MPASTPTILRTVIFKVGEGASLVAYECDVSDVTLAADTPIDKYDTLCADGTGQSAGKTNYTLNITYYQGYGMGNIARFLLENEGTEADFEFTLPGPPTTINTVTATGTVIVVPGTVGGTVNQFLTATVALPLQGKPTYVFSDST